MKGQKVGAGFLVVNENSRIERGSEKPGKKSKAKQFILVIRKKKKKIKWNNTQNKFNW